MATNFTVPSCSNNATFARLFNLTSCPGPPPLYDVSVAVPYAQWVGLIVLISYGILLIGLLATFIHYRYVCL